MQNDMRAKPRPFADRFTFTMRRAGLYGLAAAILIIGCHKDISGAFIASVVARVDRS